jgi:hypothetical protein
MKVAKRAVIFLNISHQTGQVFYNVKWLGLFVLTKVEVIGVAFVTILGLASLTYCFRTYCVHI